MEHPLVSVVIVCMNNIKNLYPCLESVHKYTNVSYETLVVAYLFSLENFIKVKSDFPWVKFIESKEIRGFSENNNLALRQAKGKYCFVLNDDTYFSEDVIGKLYKSFETLPLSVAVLSPIILNKDGSLQYNGRDKETIFTYFLSMLKIRKFFLLNSKYINGKGVYQSYNISGAAFMIRTSIFEKFRWFDERYFFCPEDIALSTELNKNGFFCFVDANIKLTHAVGGTWSNLVQATKPASSKGEYIFFSGNNLIKKMILLLLNYTLHSLYGMIWFFKYKVTKSGKAKSMYKSHFNTVHSIGSQKLPKQIFIQYYNESGKGE